MADGEVKKIATRESYGNALVELGKKNPNVVVLDADLAGATKTSTFKKEFPDRHIDCGIAEANMTGIAAGLSTCGKIPFVSSFAMFAAGRNFEQVRNSIGYPHLNVKIGATHAGITVGEDGASHQSVEDVAIMRAVPNMRVYVPCDQYETKAVIEHVANGLKLAEEADLPKVIKDLIAQHHGNIHRAHHGRGLHFGQVRNSLTQGPLIVVLHLEQVHNAEHRPVVDALFRLITTKRMCDSLTEILLL